MKIYFTADCHFDHKAIIRYSHRPFRNISQMNEIIVKRWNNKVSKEDLVYHVGDFVFKGGLNCKRFEQKLHGIIVHIKGNHDKNNGVKTYIKSCIMEFGKMKIYVAHHPPYERETTPLEKKMVDECDFVICGHVHKKWKHKIIRNKYVINVGVDVWDFEPITLLTILKYIAKLKKG